MKKTLVFIFILITAFSALFSAVGQPSYAAAEELTRITITIANEYKDMGNYNIFIEEEDNSLTPIPKNASNIYNFAKGMNIIIEAAPRPFYDFTGFAGHYPSELREGEPAKLKVKITETSRNFSLSFEPVVFEMKANIINTTKDTININVDTFKIGDYIYISLDYDAFKDIRELKINGQLVSAEDYKGKIEFINNVAAIRVTEDWLTAYGNVLDIEFSTKFSNFFAITFLCIIILIPVFALFLIYLLRTGNKQRKAAETAVRTRQTDMQRRDAGAFIQGIREGSISGKISEKQIKEELDKYK